MIRFLLVLFLFFLVLSALLGFSLLRSFRRLFFGGSSSGAKRTKKPSKHPEPPKRPKLFSKADGEYVDYEEVKG
jgi:hypothetical protein